MGIPGPWFPQLADGPNWFGLLGGGAVTVCPPLSSRDPLATKGSLEKSARMAKRWRPAVGWNLAGGWGGTGTGVGWGQGHAVLIVSLDTEQTRLFHVAD